jgi:hypothetical protein
MKHLPPMNGRHRILCAAGVVALLVLGIQVEPSLGQFATVTFPDTAVGSAKTVKCPDTSVSLCFGNPPCSGSGTLQSITGPSAPFSAGKFNLLSNSEFFAGNCEAHPVSLPVTIGPNQVFTYQVTFSPSATGTFNGSLTLNTTGGPAVVNLAGKATASGGGGGGGNTKGRAFVAIETNADAFVPGNVLDLAYRTSPETLQGQGDLYFVVQLPTGEVLFVNDAGQLVPGFEPLRRHVTVVEERQTLSAGPVPLDLPFGTYTFYMAFGYAGMTPDPANLAPFLASNIARKTVTYAALSPAQQALIETRGRPDFLTATWVAATREKTESWMYLTPTPVTRFRFLNGVLQGQEPVAGVTESVGPKFDPARFTPRTTQAQLTADFGPPTTIEPLAEGFVVLHWASGLDVVVLDGVLSSVNTFVP